MCCLLYTSFFGAAQKFQDVLGEIHDKHHTVILRMKNVPLIDATGLHRLKGIVQHLENRKRRVHLTDLEPRVKAMLEAQDWCRQELMSTNVQQVLRGMDHLTR